MHSSTYRGLVMAYITVWNMEHVDSDIDLRVYVIYRFTTFFLYMSGKKKQWHRAPTTTHKYNNIWNEFKKYTRKFNSTYIPGANDMY